MPYVSKSLALRDQNLQLSGDTHPKEINTAHDQIHEDSNGTDVELPRTNEEDTPNPVRRVIQKSSEKS